MDNKIKILIVEHNSNDIELLQHELKKSGLKYESEVVQNEVDFTNALNNFVPDIILSDFNLPSFSGEMAFKIKQELTPDTPFILISGAIGDENAIELIKNGVTDYVLKDKLFSLIPKIKRALKEAEEKKEKKRTEEYLKKSEIFSRGVLNSLESHIAVIDSLGNIIAVNDNWKQFALENGDVTFQRTGVGSNYFEVCLNSSKSGSQSAVEALQGMKDVMEEKIKYFYLDYPCHSPDKKRWFEMRVMKFESGEPLIVVAHTDISDLKIKSKQILRKNKQLKNLTSHLQRVREKERALISREIHDELGQQITALKMNIDWIKHKQTNPEEAVVSKLDEMLNMSSELIATIRRISSDLRPAIIDDLGLIAALDWKCSDFEEKMKISCSFISSVKERKFDNDFGINIYRILQETLTNASRHAEAKSVAVSVSETETQFILEIIDDGIGIKEESIANGKTLGIIGMKERAILLGGKLIIEGAKNKGTHTKLILPL